MRFLFRLPGIEIAWISKVCFDEEPDIPIRPEESRKNQSVTEWCRHGKIGVMGKNTERFCCHGVKSQGIL